MDTDTDTDSPRCIACPRMLPLWDLDRLACPDCQQRLDGQLATLPALYARLHANLAPGRGAPQFGTRHAAAASRPPIRLDVVDLTGSVGDVIAILVSWVRDWCETGHIDPPDWPPGDTQRVGVLCAWLRWHLDWACRRHFAVDEAMREIGRLHRTVAAIATGERPERTVALACPCGAVLRTTVGDKGRCCRGCDTSYTWAELQRLPLAERSAAA